ncbi:MAG: hypothetical protein U0694_04720 [Anaerolineae bacterium]
MAIRVEWYNDERSILIYHVEGAWGAADVYDLLAQISALTEDSTGIVDVIGVYQNAAIPSGDLLKPGETPTQKHPRTGIFVMVGMNRFIQQPVTETFRKLYAQGYRETATASTVDGAKGMIARRQKER